MANFLEQMESNIFDAQITRLARKTGKTPDKEFMRAMYYRVKERYKEEMQKRKIVLRQLDAVRLDEIVSYVFYYHLFHTAVILTGLKYGKGAPAAAARRAVGRG